MPFLGLRDTLDWGANTRPEDWREMIMYLYPNGRAPLTALSSMMDLERTFDPHYHWFLKKFPEQAGNINNVGTALPVSSNAKTSAQNSGSTFYITVDQAVQEEFRVGFTVLLTQKGDYRYNTRAEVISKGQDGNSDYYLEVELLEDEDGTYPINDGESDLWVEQIGSAHAEGANMPEAISYDESEGDNYTQIFRTPLKITRTTKQTRFRSTGDAARRKEEMKAEALDLHSVEMEKAFIWGEKGVDTSGDEPKRYTRGIVTALEKEGPAQNIDDFQGNGNYTGTWLADGKDWLNERLEILFRYGTGEKMVLCGSGALKGLNDLAEELGTYNIDETQTTFGMSLKRWLTPFGTVMLKTHPLMSRSPAWRNQMIVLEPRRLRMRHVQDTIYKTDPSEDQTTNDSRDRDEEEFLTEIGLEYGHLNTMGLLGSVGVDN